MEPITREEYYLAKIAGTWQGKTPEPVTIEEYYLATMVGDYSGNTPQPVTRLQYYMAKAAGVYDGNIPAPVTRLEYYWAAIAGKQGHIPDPITRKEYWLYAISKSNNDVINTASGTTIIINDATEGRPFRGLRVFGKSTQVKTTGAQLLDESKVKQNNFRAFEYINLPVGEGTFTLSSNIPKSSTDSSAYIMLISGNVQEISSENTTATNGVYKGQSRTFPSINGYVTIAYRNDANANNIINFNDYWYMLNKGAEEKPHEPYTGGKPSPSPEYPQEIVSAGESGNITVEVGGKNLLKPNSYNTYYEFPLKANTVITLMTNGKPSQGGNIKFSATDGSTVWFSIDAGQTRVCRSIGNKDVKGFYDQLKVGGGLEYMFAVGDIKTYTPYVEPQSLTLQTPNGLPGVPVSKDGNYTDENGQQYICDEIDLERGKYVQRIKKSLVLLKKTSHGNPDGYRYISYDVNDMHRNHTEILSDKFRYNEGAANSSGDITIRGIRVSPDFNAIVAFEKSVLPSELIETTVYYVLATPIERDLTPEEIAAYKALRTYGPTTVVSNDAGAGMEVTYVVER